MKGGQVLSEHPLAPGAELVVGRSEGCDVTIADGSVSRLHARVVADEEGVYVEDLGSANGTFVAAERIRGRVRLTEGQEVRVAQRAQAAPFVLRLVDELPAAQPPPPAPDQPLWRMTAPDEAPDEAPDDAPAFTMPVTESPRPAPPAEDPASEPPILYAPATLPSSATGEASMPAAAKRPSNSWTWVVAAVAVLLALGVASVAGWRWLASRKPLAVATPASATAGTALVQRLPVPDAASTQDLVPAAAPGPSPSTEVLVVPETPPTTEVLAGTVSSPPAMPARPLAGKWAARLENVFYPEDDYVIELRLDLQQRGNDVTGSGRVSIEGKAMTFGVPATAVSGTVRRGPPPWAVQLRLPFGRPIGELQLEGTLDGDALAGTFRSSAAKQPGAWHAVRSKE